MGLTRIHHLTTVHRATAADMENEFEKQGIQFKIIEPDMFQEVLEFMWKHFMPDEPIGRSLGVTRSWLVDEAYFGEAMKDGSSIVALDKEGNIIGARIGMRKWRSKWLSWMIDRIPFNMPTWMMNMMPLPGNSKETLPVILKLFTLLDYNVWRMFDVVGCDLIYEDKAVCSARTSGVRGLGTELCRRTGELAKSLGCSHTYAAVTGKYSRRIFEKLGHTVLTEVVYADFKDENGELYLKDTREHLSVITCVKEL